MEEILFHCVIFRYVFKGIRHRKEPFVAHFQHPCLIMTRRDFTLEYFYGAAHIQDLCAILF